MNRIQFQTGLLRLKFLKQLATEAQCEAELQQARWSQYFVCSCRANTGHSMSKVGSHKTFQSTRLLLTVWFLAILSWPPLPSGHTQTADFSQLKTFDNQK